MSRVVRGDMIGLSMPDVDAWSDSSTIDDIVATNSGICFAPDTLAEARNRGYRLATA